MTASITAAGLLALCGSAHQDIVSAIVPALEGAREKYGVTTSERLACFIAQVAVESAGFRSLEENLNYTADRIGQVWPRLKGRGSELAGNPRALANAAYAFRNGNGTEASGDGWKFHGRGLIQLTGAENYRQAHRGSGITVFVTPDLAAQPANAAVLALWFWQSRGCNALADGGDVDGITRLINGAEMEQANVRRQLTEKAMTIFV